MLTGTIQWTAQERVIHGQPAAEAVRGEMERLGVERVLLLTTRSLVESRLVQEISSALASTCPSMAARRPAFEGSRSSPSPR